MISAIRLDSPSSRQQSQTKQDRSSEVSVCASARVRQPIRGLIGQSSVYLKDKIASVSARATRVCFRVLAVDRATAQQIVLGQEHTFERKCAFFLLFNSCNRFSNCTEGVVVHRLYEPACQPGRSARVAVVGRLANLTWRALMSAHVRECLSQGTKHRIPCIPDE